MLKVTNLCVWSDFLTILLLTKAVPKLIGNWFFTSIVFKDPIESWVWIRNVFFSICDVCVNLIGVFNWIIKGICIQEIVCSL